LQLLREYTGYFAINVFVIDIIQVSK